VVTASADGGADAVVAGVDTALADAGSGFLPSFRHAVIISANVSADIIVTKILKFASS
jgi:hypothetical protein